ncbi:MAG: glycosyltransferase family 2 protein [Thermoplasmata archaeon]|nr:glycosyltransferase family 2 protein [Candidatus Sysuiplasma jiujiangense]
MISIVIPTINEEDSIAGVIDRIRESMSSVDEPYEILIIDTNSSDRTVEIARERGCRIIRESERGYGRAYKTGFAASAGTTIIALDADASYPPEAIPALLSVFKREGLDFLTANRFSSMNKGAMSRTHRFGNWILNVATRFLFSVSVRDSQSGMWILKKDAFERLDVRSDGFPFSEEIKIKAAKRLKFAEVPVHFMERQGEKKLNTWKDGWNNLKFLLKLRFSRRLRN